VNCCRCRSSSSRNLAAGALIARFSGNGAWFALGGVGFVFGMINVFTGSMVNAVFLIAYGTFGSAVITHAEAFMVSAATSHSSLA